MKKFKQIYHWLKNILKSSIHTRHSKLDFRDAKAHLMASTDISEYDKTLLNNVSLQVHYKDSMYKKGRASHYLSVGLSAHNCIKEALAFVGNEYRVNSILDFPCGYGRVLRFLRTAFPNSEIIGAEISSTALKFCNQNFNVNTIMSNKNFNKINFPQQFDLIWCGSLVTHIDEPSTANLLKFFYDHLSEHGICIFTTHGKYSNDLIENKRHSYGMTKDAQLKVLHGFQTKGYGYTDYLNHKGYGISLVSKEKIKILAEKIGNWDLVMFKERGWDNHQDVYAFKKLGNEVNREITNINNFNN